MYWLIIAAIGFIIGYSFDSVLGAILFKKNKKFKIKDIRFHHSFLGLLCFIIGVYYYTYFFIGVGIGIIVSHAIREKSLIFLEIGNKKYF